MKASELIKELTERMDMYGDWFVYVREIGEVVDEQITAVFGDEEEESIIISACGIPLF